MTLSLFDSFTRTVRPFEPLEPPRVGLYTCGLTVYDYAHIGNLRTYIFEDLLRRALVMNGYTVRHVMNITDVGHLVADADIGEDKMEQGAVRTGRSVWEIAEHYLRAFRHDLAALNILEPDIWCKATDHIAEQIAMIQCIESRGFTYRTSDGIYFDTSRQPDYGYLARLDRAGLQPGARVDMGEKKNPTDFALWKISPPGTKRQMQWDSPWGIGFPGWHIECSAMSAKYLGSYFDIHCGGEDHISIHHPNEIAQTEACYGTRLANFWMHGYFLQFGAERMSKSSGTFVTLAELARRGVDPLAYRYFCLGAHYRTKLNFTWESLEGAARAFGRLRSLCGEWGPPAAPDQDFMRCFREAIDDDLNLPRALAVTWDLVKSALAPGVKKQTILSFDEVLGLKLAEPADREEAIPDEILELVRRRGECRARRLWKEADALRAEIHAAGFRVEDTPQGARIKGTAKT
jgi:cysteinyl-tRNA synthetase